MSNKSKLNVNLFSEYPHGLADKNNTIIDWIIKSANKKAKKQYGLPNNFTNKTVIEFGCGAVLKLLPYAHCREQK